VLLSLTQSRPACSAGRHISPCLSYVQRHGRRLGASGPLEGDRRCFMLRTVAESTVLAFILIAQASAQQISEQQAYEIAKDAYVYAYPLVLEYVTKIQGTNYAEPTGIPAQSPFNQFGHARAFPPADFKAVVRPNADTLYSVANLDLGREPVVLSVPATDRF